FAKAFQASPIPIAICRLEDRVYVDVNDSWVKLFGYSREEAIGHTGAELRLWVDEQVRSQMYSALNEQSWLRDQEIKVRTKTGVVLSALWSAVEISLEQGIFTQSMTYNITERKQAEQQRLELALANERVQFLTEFLGNISHDLKTPLAVINTSLYLLEHLNE